MRIHKNIYKVVFYILLILQVFYTDVEFLVGLSFSIIFLLLVEKRVLLSKSMYNFLAFTSFLLFLGVVSGLFHAYTFFDRIRDVVHFLKPITVVLMGYLVILKIDNTKFVLKSIVQVSIFFAIKHFIDIALGDFVIWKISEIRYFGGAGNFLELVAIVLLIIFHKKSEIQIFRSTIVRSASILLLSISCIFYFSRTMVLGFIILLLSVYGFTKLSRKVIEYATLLFIVFGLFFTYLFTLDLDVDKPGVEGFLFKIRNSPAEVFTSPKGYDPTNHKEIFKHWRGYEASKALKSMDNKPVNYIFGKGFGALADLGFKAPVGGEDGLQFIPHFHNGYIYVLFKTGVIGLFFYLVLLINIYKQIYIKSKSSVEKILREILSGFGIYFLLTSFVITGIYNLGEISIFLLGVFLCLVHTESLKKEI